MEKINLVFTTRLFAADAGKVIGDLDFSVASLRLIDDYLQKTVHQAGKPIHGSYFQDIEDEKFLHLGMYTGEVIRRHCKGVRWVTEDVDGITAFYLEDSFGNKAFPLQVSYRRLNEDAGISLENYVNDCIRNLFSVVRENLSAFDEEDLRIHKYGKGKLALLSKKIKNERAELHRVNISDGIYTFASKNDGNATSLDLLFELTFLNEVIEMFPELAEFPETDENANIVRQKDGSFIFQKAHESLLFGGGMASFQGNMSVNFFRWAKVNGDAVLVRTMLWILFTAMAIRISPWWWIGAAIMVIVNVVYWLGVWNTFKGGLVSPGKVVSVNPDIIAVATDMSKMAGQYPVLTIKKIKLAKEDKIIGKIIPTISVFYNYYKDLPFWAAYSVVPVSYGITDTNQLQYLMDRFEQDEFDKLNHAIDQVGHIQPGVYKIDPETSAWKDFPLYDVSKPEKAKINRDIV